MLAITRTTWPRIMFSRPASVLMLRQLLAVPLTDELKESVDRSCHAATYRTKAMSGDSSRERGRLNAVVSGHLVRD